MIKGYELLVMANKGELKPKTIIRTIHKREYFDDNKDYDYYIYHNDKMFHRCHEDGRLGSKFQNRFLNYEVLQQDFEIYKEIEEKIEPYTELTNLAWTKEQQDNLIDNFDRINTILNKLINEIDSLKENINENN